MAQKILIEGASANGNYPDADGTTLTFKQCLLSAWGTWDGASVALEVCPNKGDAVEFWGPIHDAAGTPIAVTDDTADTWVEFIPQGYSVRAVVSSVGTTLLNIRLTN